jgi:hypothetical protein
LEEQSKGIQFLQSDCSSYISQINSNHHDIIQSLLDCPMSLRTALSKISIECLKSLLQEDSINIVSSADNILTSLLTVVSNGKNFIAALTG